MLCFLLLSPFFKTVFDRARRIVIYTLQIEVDMGVGSLK